MFEEVTITVDKELLEQFSAVCAELGVTVEETVVAFFEAVVRDRSILEELIEEEQDRLVYEGAMAEYQKNPVSYPISELWKELGLDEKLEEAEREAERNDKRYTAEEVLGAMRESIGGEK